MGGNSQSPDSGGNHRSVGSRPERLSACCVTALVLGVVGTVLSFIPIVNNVAAVLGVIGVVFAIIGLVGVVKGKKRGRALTIAGAVLSVVAIVITLAMQSSASKAFDSASKASSSSSSQSQSAGKQNAQPTKPESKSSAGKQDTEGDLKRAHVKIASAVRSGNDYNNAQTVLVTYQWTNKTDDNQAFETLLNAKAFQNGQELDMAIYSQPPQGYDAQSALAQLQPNAQGTATIGYVLKDNSPVTVEVSDLLTVDGSPKVMHIYNL
ncbi:MAG: DUF5067 domain-containing protein [Bifidobacterium sp.]|nr:DUF5067 domain-containing protein [Bifidobacterium sp.]